MKKGTTIIRGGTVVCEHEVLLYHDVIIKDGIIESIRPTVMRDASEEYYGNSASDLVDSAQSIMNNAVPGVQKKPHIIDAQGAYVLPGLIDIHSDYIETVASPRPSVIMDLETSLYEAERELVAHGITTMFHSLSVYQQKIFDHKPIRNFENVSALIDQINTLRATEEYGHLIRHRVHLRIELDSINLYEAEKKYLKQGFVDLVSFMDHTPGQGQYADIKLFGETLKGYRSISDEEVAEIVASQQQSEKLSLAHMAELARIAHNRGIAVASHDDDTCEKLDLMESINAEISEFPITLPVAQSARSRGMYTLAGAPNVLMGHSHSGNLSAREAIGANAINILCSDYYPSAMLNAVFTLHHTCGIGLSKAVGLVSINPARAVHMDNQFGSIMPGKTADVLIVRELAPERPVVVEAFVGGHSVYKTQYPKFASATLQQELVAMNQELQETDLVWDESSSRFVEVSR